MNADERAALHNALAAAVALENPIERSDMVDYITDIGAAKGRTLARRESDARTDFKRRSLVGARVARDQVERCQRCAQLEGKSLYRFVIEALEASCLEVERMFDRAGGQPVQPETGGET